MTAASRGGGPDAWLGKAVVSLGAAFFVAIAMSIQLSTISLNFGSVLHGSDTLWRGHTAAFRLAAIEPKSAGLLTMQKVSAELVDDHGLRVAAEVVNGQKTAILSVEVPEEIDEHATLRVKVVVDDGIDAFDVPVIVADEPGRPRGRLAANKEELATGEPASSLVMLYPASGHFVAGLKNQVIGQVLQKGTVVRPGGTTGESEPRVTALELGLNNVKSVNGFFRGSLMPHNRMAPLEVEVGFGEGTKSRVRVPIVPRPSQLVLAVRGGPMVAAGATIEVRILTLPFRGAVEVDMWVGNTLVRALSAVPQRGGLDVGLEVPHDARGLLRVQAYKNLVSPGGSVSEVARWALGRGEGVKGFLKSYQGSGAVLGHLESGGVSPMVSEIALSRFVSTARGAPRIWETLGGREMALERERGRLRSYVHYLYLGCAVAFVLLVVFVGLGYYRQRRLGF